MSASRPRTDPTLLWASLAAFLIAGALAWAARGLAGDEEALHYLMGRYAPGQPELFLRLNGRPLVTLSLAIPAQFGFLAARLSAALVTALGAVAVARIALRAGWLSPLWLVGYLFVQPFFIAHSGTTMTEPWAAALVAWGLLAVVERRYVLLAVVTALLPLARMETLAFWPFVIALVVRERAWRTLFLLPIPLLLWDFFGWLTSGDPIWLLHQSNWRVYPERASLHYVKSFVWVVGIGLFVPVVVGFLDTLSLYKKKNRKSAPPEMASARTRASLAAAVVVFVFLGVYTVLAVWHPITFGNLRYFAYAAPAFAVLGAVGTHSLFGKQRAWSGWAKLGAATLGAAFLWNHPLVGDFGIVTRLDLLPLAVALLWVFLYLQPVRVRVLAPLLVVVLGAFGLLRNHTGTLHLRPTPEHVAIAKAARSLTHPLPAPYVFYGAHPMFSFYRGTNPYDRVTYPAITARTPTTAPVGSLLFWETHYALRKGRSLDLRSFSRNRTWRYLGGVLSSDSLWAGAFFERWTTTPPDSGSVPPPLPPLVTATLDRKAWINTALLTQSGVPQSRLDISLDPRNSRAWLKLATSLSLAGMHGPALSALEEAKRLDPGDPLNLGFEAELRRMRGDVEGSLQIARQALALDPDNGDLHYQVGRVLLQLKRPQEARPHLVEAARQKTKRWGVQYSAAVVLYQEQRWAEAEPYFLATLRLQPAHAASIVRVAEISWRLGRHDQAVNRLRGFIRQNSTIAAPYVLLGDLLTRLDRPEEAQQVWREGMQKTGDDPEIASRLQASQ